MILIFSLAVLGLVGEGGRFLLCSVSNFIGRCKVAHLENIKQKILRRYALLEQDADSLKGLLEVAEFHDYQMRTTDNFEQIPEEVRQQGVGGPMEESDEMKELYSMGSREYKSLSGLEQSISGLLRKARFQSQSYADISKGLNDRQFMLDHTPSVLPTKGYFSSGFGGRPDPFDHHHAFHTGVDIADREGRQGIPVIASAEGTCSFIGLNGGYGLCIIVDHGNGVETLYGHLSRAYVWVGDKIERFQIIGTTGSSGRATGPHLHYEVRVSGIPVDPKGYFVEDDTDGMILDYLDSIPATRSASIPTPPAPAISAGDDGDSYMQLYQKEITPVTPVTPATPVTPVTPVTPAAGQKPDSATPQMFEKETFYWGDALSVRDDWQAPR